MNHLVLRRADTQLNTRTLAEVWLNALAITYQAEVEATKVPCVS